LKAEWVDVLPDAFETVSIDIADGCGHFVHYEIRVSGFRRSSGIVTRSRRRKMPVS
jgi:hypothetical protein